MNLKKAIFIIAIIASVLMPIVAEESGEKTTKAELSYYNAPVYRIMDSNSAYVVTYAKYGTKVGSVTIPKHWARAKPGEVKKLLVRKLPPKMSPYITVVKKNGEFNKVILTIPTSHDRNLWGIINESKVQDVDGIESIELEL